MSWERQFSIALCGGPWRWDDVPGVMFGVPTLVSGGHRVVGAQPYEALVQLPIAIIYWNIETTIAHLVFK
jgi:hypothetical protein